VRLLLEAALRLRIGQALTSLAEAHDKGVIHRDLKPDNLVLVAGASGILAPAPSLRSLSSGDHAVASPAQEGTHPAELSLESLSGDPEICTVLDFGIAKLVSREAGIDALETQAGTVFGTPRYMSPEQAQGKPLDARSDIYSLGVILYHMLLGRPPFTDGDAVVVMAHHIKTPPKRPTAVDPTLSLPPGLEDLLMRVIAKDPDRRPQSAVAFIAALDELGDLELSQMSAELTAVVGHPPAVVASRRVMMAGIAAAASVGVGLSAAVGGAVSRVLISSQTAEPSDASEPPAALEAPPAQPVKASPSVVGPAPKRRYQRFDR
jgi:serine/threonine protein kinase